MTDTGASSLAVRRPWWVLAGLAALCVVLGSRIGEFRIDASADTLLSEDNQHYLRALEVSRQYAPDEFILLAVEPSTAPLFSETTYAVIDDLRRRIGDFERVKSVRSILDVPLLRLAGDRGATTVDPARWTWDQQQWTPEQMASAFRDHPIYEDLLVNDDQTATAVQVVFRRDQAIAEIQGRILELRLRQRDEELSDADRDTLAELRERLEPLEHELGKQRRREVEAIRAIAAEHAGEATIHLGGVHVLGAELVRIVTRDLVVFGTAMALIICTLLWLLFRRRRWVLIPLACCAASVVATMGLFGWLGLKATVISSNFVAIQLILTLGVVIHLIVQYRERARDNADADITELVAATMRDKRGPCIQAGLTTCLGFASLMISDIAPVSAFGAMMLLATGLSLLISLSLFPALLSLLARRDADADDSRVRALMERVADTASRNGGRIHAAFALLLVAAALGLPRLDVENSFINYFDDSTRVHRELAFIDRQLGGSTPLDVIYTVPADEQHPELVLTAGTVAKMRALQTRLAEEAAIGKQLSVVNFTQWAVELNNGQPLTEFELTALYRLIDAELREELLGSYLRAEPPELRLSIRVQDTTPELDREQLLNTVRRTATAAGLDPEQVSLTNLLVLYQDLLQRLFRSQILTLAAVFAAIGVAFLVVFRSWRLAAIGLATNLLATGTVLGAIGWLGIPLDFMTITIAAITMGIAVDDTIHYVHRYRHALRGGDTDRAIADSHRSIGSAMLYTSLIIATGFVMFAFSDFVPSKLFGLLTGLAIGVALIADLTLLPAMLKRWYPAGRN